MGILKDILQKAKGNLPLDAKRSSQWAKVRKQHLIDHPACAGCGETTKVEVHHIKPFHLHPEDELNPDNLITLCENASYGIICHLNIGHSGNYKHCNEDVVKDAAEMFARLTRDRQDT